jgi:hypothetical protein
MSAPLLAEKTRLEKKMKRLDSQFRECSRRVNQIDRQLYFAERRKTLAPLIGVSGGVKISYRVAPDDRDAWMNTALGTLLDIRRSRVTVDYGDHKRWNLHLRDVVPAGERQSVTFAAMAAGDMGD